METSINLEIYVKQNWHWRWLVMPMRRIYHEYLPLQINTLLNGKLMDGRITFWKNWWKITICSSSFNMEARVLNKILLDDLFPFLTKTFISVFYILLLDTILPGGWEAVIPKFLLPILKVFRNIFSSGRPVEIALCINSWGCLSDFLQRLSPWLGKF